MLQYAFRIGMRRRFSVTHGVFRVLDAPVVQVEQTSAGSDQDANATRDNYNCIASGGHTMKLAAQKGHAVTPFVSAEIDPISCAPPQVELPRSSREKARSAASNGSRKASCTFHPTLADWMQCDAFSYFWDVDSLAPYEVTLLDGDRDFNQSWISEDEMRGVLSTAVAWPSKRLNNNLAHPVTPDELLLRLHEAMTFSPLPLLSRLISYHDSYPTLQSAASYHFLVQLAIRHTSYSKALQLLRRMEESGVTSDDYSKLLYAKLLVRLGRWDRAWSFVQQEVSNCSETARLPLLLELLGHFKKSDFRVKLPSNDISEQNQDQISFKKMPVGVRDPLYVQSWQKYILAAIPNHFPSDTHPPDHFILKVVRHLLHIKHADTARAVTMEWISNLPKTLSLLRKRRCLSLMHLHLALSPFGLAAHIANREFVNVFLEQQANLRPNSTTLFLLLRDLTRSKGKTTFQALQLVHAFRKRWGTDVVDRRVRRRVVSIAVREGRLNVARTWLAAEEMASQPRKVMALQRQAVGEAAIKPPQRIRRVAFQKLMPGIEDENRKWRWVKRRIWKREQTVQSK